MRTKIIESITVVDAGPVQGKLYVEANNANDTIYLYTDEDTFVVVHSDTLSTGFVIGFVSDTIPWKGTLQLTQD